MTGREALIDQARTFSALSDPTRLRLLKLLSQNRPGALCVNAMAAWLGVSQPAVSQHLRVLKGAGLISGERRGYHVHYVLQPEAMKRCQDTVAAVLGAAGPADEAICRKKRTGKGRCGPDDRQGRRNAGQHLVLI